jgi:peptidyl-tRNA hydrolase
VLKKQIVSIMTLIQYIIVRSDLIKTLKWNIGALIAQACHAVATVNELNKDDELTRQYLHPENIYKMHKCVLAVGSISRYPLKLPLL